MRLILALALLLATPVLANPADDRFDTPVTQSARIIDGEWKLIDVN